ncbi:sensor histidine kinase [Saccharothrix sp. ST-888]|uniref:sensor histidine kinase n=1 Tax=Saccharothrix sp. ST-888 TaxID=1427391 RepID=UPI0012E00E79|nr:ATP-binding protein [Saccharothrix sp. ST-888]
MRRLTGVLLPGLAGAAVLAGCRRSRRRRAAGSGPGLADPIELAYERGRLEERERIARDAHDTVVQGLAAITLLVRAVEHALPAGVPELAQARERLAAVQDTARLSLGQAQDLTAGVAVSQLGTGGLVPALTQYVALSRRNLDIVRRLLELGPALPPCAAGLRAPELELRITGPARRFGLVAESAALRLVQEAVANAVQHAGAQAVTVELRHLADRVQVLVRDDGAGLSPNGRPGCGLGLAGAEERIGRLGGRLTLDSAPGGGTTLTVEFCDRGARSAGERRRPERWLRSIRQWYRPFVG